MKALWASGDALLWPGLAVLRKSLTDGLWHIVQLTLVLLWVPAAPVYPGPLRTLVAVSISYRCWLRYIFLYRGEGQQGVSGVSLYTAVY